MSGPTPAGPAPAGPRTTGPRTAGPATAGPAAAGPRTTGPTATRPAAARPRTTCPRPTELAGCWRRTDARAAHVGGREVLGDRRRREPQRRLHVHHAGALLDGIGDRELRRASLEDRLHLIGREVRPLRQEV